MSLSHEQLCELHDSGYERGQYTRDQASNDLVFNWITQWDDALLDGSNLQYKGEFNIIRKAVRQIAAQIHSNPVQVDFEPLGRAHEDDADLADGIYRASCRDNASIEAFDNAADESIACGVAAWELYNDYETSEVGEQQQVIRRRPLHEAVNTVIWDPNAKLLDKSDADWCSVLVPYSEDGYRKLHRELTGEDVPDNFVGLWFKSPNQDYSFPWVGTSKQVYVTRFYHRELVDVTVFVWKSPEGDEIALTDEQLADPETADMLVDGEYELVDERTYERHKVTRYIASGGGILAEEDVPGTELPVVPMYGERAMVEGEEHYEGVVRLAKDPQRLRNFQFSYLADILGRSPRQKDIYLPEQIAGHQRMYEESGADSDYPYVLQNRADPNGTELPLGPVGRTGDQSIPPALPPSLELTRQAVEDVANPGLPQNIADPDLSGKAVQALQERMDMQSFVYQKNFKHAKRRDGAIFASMLGDVYDTPRTVNLYLPDDTRKEVQLMAQEWDTNAWQERTVNDLRGKKFNVYATIGRSYSNQKQQTRDELRELMAGMAPNDPMREVMLLKYTTMMDGTDTRDIREYARMQLVIKGVIEPETDEERQKYMEIKQAQGDQKDPLMVAAEAEAMKAQADGMNARTKEFEAKTKRLEAMAKAQKLGLDARKVMADTEGQKISNAAQMQEMMTRELTLDFATGQVVRGAG